MAPERGARGYTTGRRRGAKANASSSTASALSAKANGSFASRPGQSWRKRTDSSLTSSTAASTPTAASVASSDTQEQPSSELISGHTAATAASDASALVAGFGEEVATVEASGSQEPVPAALPPRQTERHREEPDTGGGFLMEMLAAMDHHMQHLRKTQQGLVAIIEHSCRQALDGNFGRLVLVGSAALRVETPGSDIDVVCFTRQNGHMPVSLPVDCLRGIHWALLQLISQYTEYAGSFAMELIEDARVPILRVLWGPPGNPVAVDVAVDQSLPVDHVRWFQRVGAAPRPTAPQPVVAPLVTLTLRCIKWWLRQRQIPRTKEGGMATLAWLLMVVHVCSLPETHEQAIVSGQRPMAALLASLSAFFRNFASLQDLDGVLQFAHDGSSSDFKKRTEKERRAAPWAELVILDPTKEGMESLNLVPRLAPATQLLLVHELKRAGGQLQRVATLAAERVDCRHVLKEMFEPLPEGINTMPSQLIGDLGVLILRADNGQHALEHLEMAIVEQIVPRHGWAAPFLLRNDERSEIYVKICDVDVATGRCTTRKKGPIMMRPSSFVGCVHLDRHGGSLKLDAAGLQRYSSMRQLVIDACMTKVAEHDGSSTNEVAEAQAEKQSTSVELGLSSIPSPIRSRATRL